MWRIRYRRRRRNGNTFYPALRQTTRNKRSPKLCCSEYAATKAMYACMHTSNDSRNTRGAQGQSMEAPLPRTTIWQKSDVFRRRSDSLAIGAGGTVSNDMVFYRGNGIKQTIRENQQKRQPVRYEPSCPGGSTPVPGQRWQPCPRPRIGGETPS